MMLATLPNNSSGKRLFMQHTLAIPACCPVSHNPMAGSTLTIRYRAAEQVLDVLPLKAYIHRYVGGWHNEDGVIVLRDMEGMLLKIAHDVAQAVGVLVQVRAVLVLRPKQTMHVIARGYPEGGNYDHLR